MNVVGLFGFLLGVLMLPLVAEKLFAIGSPLASLVFIAYLFTIGSFLLFGLKAGET